MQELFPSIGFSLCGLIFTIIISIIYIIPFVTISSIQRGFLHGKEDMLGASITNVTEEIIKITLIII